MYLKSVEVQGFKSFAHKMVFEFHNGITGIVGPNGSGKSNVADAVRWVLGEQRAKQLRGGSMQDVIFSGTESRKPLSYASVAITLDNSDHKLPVQFDEIKVTRKLYRSGDSEYLINGSPCRLKDINEMFYDTGIGKEGYSIIGQGQIEKILNGKPEERRELFDEAAGIVKFKRRKNLSLKKLEEEQQNLVRVTDIIKELEKQTGPLQRQSETAREYLKKKEELKKYDINMFLLETLRLKDQMDVISKNLDIASDDFKNSEKKYNAMKTEYEKIEDKVDLINSEIEESKTQLNQTTLLKQQLENRIALLKEQINSVKSNDSHFRKRADSIQEELSQRETQRDGLILERNKISDSLTKTKADQDQANAELADIQMQIVETNEQIEKNQVEIRELLNNRASTKAKIQHYDTMMDQIKIRNAELNKHLLEIDQDIKVQKKNKIDFTTELDELNLVISENETKTSKIQSEIDELQNLISSINDKVQYIQGNYHRQKSRLESLKNITERYDGYGNSIRKVMEKKATEPGLIGVVADIIQVDKAYETAIETALGGSIQNIVTKNEQTAKNMIEYLKKNKFGRATFLPLTSLRGNNSQIRKDVLSEPGVINTADKLVRVDAQFKILAENLLGRTVVCDNIDTGIRLARKYNQSLRIVSLEGELINPGGAISGGAFKNAGNLLSRRREIEELETTVAQLKKDMNSMSADLAQKREERVGLYNELDNMKKSAQDKLVRKNTLQMHLDQIEAKYKFTLESINSIQRERAELKQQSEEIRDNKLSIELELETSEDVEKEISGQVEAFQTQIETCRLSETQAVEKKEKIQLAYAALEQKSVFIDENLTRIEAEIGKFKEELSTLGQSKDENSAEIRNKEDEISDIINTIENSKEIFEEIQKQIEEYQVEKEQLTQKHKVFLQEREDVSKHMSELDKEMYRLNSQKENCEEASEKQINYMWEEYEITYNHALELRDDTLSDLSAMKKRIYEIKAEIKNLGPVNVNAIEDYKNLSERYEFMNGQYTDLVTAEETLKNIITELDQAMRRQFTEQFARISEEFNKTFKELFGGGKGTLELIEGEDILEAGIRIIAHPPGKKLQNMMQLSGGEKALTAIALLFAIQNLKPSPFCLLDEIEAALDDSNVTRFADYLHKLTKHTQFIVITHRRGTMNAADRLYGITMQEKGISTQVSIDLIENEINKQEEANGRKEGVF